MTGTLGLIRPWLGTCGLFVSLLVFMPAVVGAEPKLEQGKEGRHPVVPAFERFYRAADADHVQGGRLLLTELSCVGCHQPRLASPSLEPKSAPSLDGVGSRVRPEFLLEYLVDPQRTKPGTTMPNLLAHLPEAERKSNAEAITHFLASTGTPIRINPTHKAILNGRKLFNSVGCLACHDSPESSAASNPTSVPLGELGKKYTLSSLGAFLTDPLKVRASGRMPAFKLNASESGEIAAYLLRDLSEHIVPNLSYAYYEGRWDNLPNFDELKPVKTGESMGIDLTVAKRPSQYGIVWNGFLQIERDGDYTFYLKSDDGSRMMLDGELAVENDGVHPMKERRGTHRLTKGTYRFQASYFNSLLDGEFEFDYSGPGIPRQPITPALTLTEHPNRKASGGAEAGFKVDQTLASQGRELFKTIGCASCHSLKVENELVRSQRQASPLDALQLDEGCLASSASPSGESPHYNLDEVQRTSLKAAIEALQSPSKPTQHVVREQIAENMLRLNCMACHSRAGEGGVDELHNPAFQTRQAEMGDEGRLPPSLDGVGAKLTHNTLLRIMRDGAKDRPYMLTRMPGFGKANSARLSELLQTQDQIDPIPPVHFDDPVRRVKSDGRYMVGNEALGCVKCHTFNGVEAEGIQAIDMAVMTTRLRRDWFHRYLVDPQQFRPGTRMPGAWPMGQSLLPSVLKGDTNRQIEAVWTYLADGKSAPEPYGLGREPIPLVPNGEPLIYRNFIQGAGPRGIAVGYPEKLNLAFDANDVRLALIWQGAFIDASRHWSARGAGFQGPLGNNVLEFATGPAFAQLGDRNEPWPDKPGREHGARFRGYRLDANGRPTFLYEAASVRVEDAPEPLVQAGKEQPSLKRTLMIRGSSKAGLVWFRAAVGKSIDPVDGGKFRVDREWLIQLEAESQPFVRKSAGKAELLLPIPLGEKASRVIERIEW